MKELELVNTVIPQDIVFNLGEHYEFAWLPDRVPEFYRVMFFTVAEVLKHYKSKEENPKLGFIFKDLKGNFKFGAIMNYHAPEDGDDDDGNYTLEFTLNEKDMSDIPVPVDSQSDMFITCVSKIAHDVMGGQFKSMQYCNNLFCEFIDTLVTYLDKNAIADDELNVVLKGIFTATITCKKDKKVITLVPGEMVKQAIKRDVEL